MDKHNVIITNRDEIRELLGKTKELVFKDIEIIKEWLKTQKHLPEIPSENMIEFFLNNCKFSIEKTKKHLDMYYTLRTLLPEYFHNMNPCEPCMEEVFRKIFIIPLPKLTSSKERLIVFKYKDIDDLVDIHKIYGHYLNNVYEIRTHEDLSTGDIYVGDLQYLSLAMAARSTPLILKQMAFIVEHVHSSRMKGIYMYNCPNYLSSFVSLFKSFLSKKLSERIHIYSTIEDMTKDFPLDILPSDFGGNEKSLDELEAMWRAKFLEYKDRFEKLKTMKVNEELRPEKLKNDEILGYYGNFKKIETD